MNRIEINSNFSVSEQITLEDIKSLKALGITTLICNRPDGEEPNQLMCCEIKAEAEKQGIQFFHIPVAGREIPQQAFLEFVKTIDQSTAPVHAYCRTGTRSAIFWALSEARNCTPEAVLKNAKAVGIDLTPVADQLAKVANL
ncbi:MAG: TIGR01244 family sulfur transferase [Enterobacterales bacterium]|nr:TIGR01244 family sulfur transferase [Enterobacterales bacterium]